MSILLRKCRTSVSRGHNRSLESQLIRPGAANDHGYSREKSGHRSRRRWVVLIARNHATKNNGSLVWGKSPLRINPRPKAGGAAAPALAISGAAPAIPRSIAGSGYHNFFD